MKILFLTLTLLLTISNLTWGSSPSDQKLLDLEARVLALENAVKEKLEDCQLTYKIHSIRLNECDPGTFAYSVQKTANGLPQLECGYYQLQCSRKK
jgi:hypothetical protein